MDQKHWAFETLPNFRGVKVLILPGAYYAQTVKMFCEAGCKKAWTVEEADIVVFLGGADISPSYYGQKPIDEVTHVTPQRDRDEKKIYEAAVKQNKTIFGICRGAQFVHAMNGGVLWQHVDNHSGPPHDIYDIDEDIVVKASSFHHQMMQFNREMSLLAVTNQDVANIFKNEHNFIDKTRDKEQSIEEIEVEACYYEDTKSLCIQGHPEVGPRKFTSWSMYKLIDLYNEWNDDYEQKQEEVIDCLV